MKNSREIGARLAFPLIMGLGLWTTFYFIHIKGLDINKVTFPIVFIALITIAIVERFLPYLIRLMVFFSIAIFT